MGRPTTSPADPFDRRLLDLLPVGLAVYDLPDPDDPASLRVRYANPASVTLAGVDLRAHMGKPLVEAAPSVSDEGLLKRYADVIRTGTPQDFGSEGDPTGSGALVRAIPIGDDALAVVDGSATEGARALQVARDDLAREEDRSRTLLDAIGDVVLVYPIGPDGPEPFVAFNQSAVARYGYTADELRTLTIHDILDPDRFDEASALDELRRNRRATFDSVHRTRNGERLYMSTHARLAELDGRLCVVALARDDSDRRSFRREIARTNRKLEVAVGERTRQLEAFSEDLKILHGITTAVHETSAARFDAYLRAGCEMFDLPNGILSQTPRDPETGERDYRLVAVVSPDPALQPGLTVPIQEAFCDAVVETMETVTYADAEEEAPAHPACVSRGLRAFIGTPVVVDGELFGTLNFVSPEPRPEGFSAVERDLVEVMAQAVARSIATDRAERAEANLRERYRAIVETVDAGVVVVDEHFEVIMANPSAKELMGLDVDHGYRETDDFPDRWPVVDAGGRSLTREELPEYGVFESGEPIRGTIQGIAPPGEPIRWYRVNATPLEGERDGDPGLVVVSFHDVSDLQGAAVTAGRAQGVLRAVLRASTDGLVSFRSVRDGAGEIVDFEWQFVTPLAGAIVGRAPSWLVGRRLLEAFPGNRESGLFDAYRDVVETGVPYEAVVDYPYDGFETSFRIRAVRLDGADGFVASFSEAVSVERIGFETEEGREEDGEA